ncbi:hypothetical protein [Limnohabitans sp. 2KL-3]|uniref:hypothetical protein n=1 Tax=Limnohabitans sp. 2KL-3 TaxID=1100700 RepID=UPI000A8FB5B6|nr:hypothetical protein [Limnohabitans sp. 2KL-3]
MINLLSTKPSQLEIARISDGVKALIAAKLFVTRWITTDAAQVLQSIFHKHYKLRRSLVMTSIRTGACIWET